MDWAWAELLAFGSLVLPVKAVVMNLFSITASFGVITWIFSDGNLSDFLGFTPQGYLDATNPILMLAILFGLSMDYEVFLLSRVREEWDRTHDNDLAVATGVQKTGRIITSAALLLAVEESPEDLVTCGDALGFDLRARRGVERRPRGGGHRGGEDAEQPPGVDRPQRCGA